MSSIVNQGGFFMPSSFPIMPQYQKIRDSIDTNRQARYAANRAYLSNDIAAQLTQTIEADVIRLQNEQALIKMQLAQLQSRLNLVG